jgi:uncharacterized membrane protein YjjB (DUF3815 family)
MSIGQYAFTFFSSVAATFCFAILFRSPVRALPVSSLLGGVAYLLYLVVLQQTQLVMLGYFLGTLLAAVVSEVAARVMKMPATTFLIPSVIVMVPGFGLYKTMLFLVQGGYEQAAAEGTQTILAIGAMALAIALGSLVFRVIRPRRKEKA